MDRESEVSDSSDWTRNCMECGESLEDHALVVIDGKEEGICPVEAIAVDAETSQQVLPGIKEE